MYSQQFQSNVGSQYQGIQRQYQPVGAVQSFYGANQSQQQQYGNYPSAETYHTANYRGNQMGHDASLRGDSFSPAQHQGFGAQGLSQANYGSPSFGIRGNQQAWSGHNNVSSQFGFGNPYGSFQAQGATASYGGQTSFGQGGYAQNANPSAESYHTANYRGNQMGHDASLRGDSFSPAQHQQGSFGMQQSGFGQGAHYGSASYGIRGNEQAWSGHNNVSQQFGYNNPF
ncbi:hypothetical protein [Gordoniibacillus kamchatkensis]|uniref:hypothetical protein n=1 Tax=Gordoniibacillus kamchatkensis TaxID=1590651 RepID=UPI000697D7D1|nr:hypothetical protein [Paenibacillus sp. VKM B-2647]